MAGNEFIEALNPLPDDDLAFKVLRATTIKRTDEFFSRSLEHRIEAIHDIDDIFVPLPVHCRALQSTMALVRRGLLHRDPRNPKVAAHMYRCATATEAEWRSGKAERLLTAMCPSGGAAMGELLYGPTGVGKTTLVKRISSYVGTEADQGSMTMGGSSPPGTCTSAQVCFSVSCETIRTCSCGERLAS